MGYQVPYLTEDALEREADVLLAQFCGAERVPLVPPIPVEDILEKHLKISLDLDDLHKKLGIPIVGGKRDILGAIWLDDRSVFIDRSLDPAEYPDREGRYRFTVAHEVGHWQVHREHLPSHAGQADLFGAESQPTIVCRESESKERIEWQADFFAACLLMPRSLMMEAWKHRFGDKRRVVQPDDPAQLGRFHQEFLRPFATDFVVSREAMQIRLEQLQLLQLEPRRQPALRGGL